MKLAPTKYIWAKPLQTFLPSNHSEVLVCLTQDQSHIPDYCCRCGSARADLYPLKIKPISDQAHDALRALPGPIGAGIGYLATKKVWLPCCSSCRLVRHLGYALAFFFFALGVTPSVLLACLDQATKLQLSQTTELLAVLSLFFVPAAGFGISCWCSWRSLPVIVYSFGDTLYMEFWSPQYQQQMLDLASPEKIIPCPPSSN